jgi:hypothetical protein
MRQDEFTPKPNFVLNPREYFVEVVEAGLSKRGLRTYPAISSYLVNLLEHYLDARNLFEGEDETFAEAFLRATQSDHPEKPRLLKKVGDRALYLSGFFGESLERKIVDFDYYTGIGVAAYRNLAEVTKEDTSAQVYRMFSNRFVDFVDVLTHISHQAFVNSDESILRLYNRYLRTGSELARERLNEMGVITVPQDQFKKDLKS